MKKVWVLMATVLLLSGSTVAQAKADAELQAQIEALQSRITELENQQSTTQFQQRNGELIRQMVEEASADYQVGADSAVTAGYDGNFFNGIFAIHFVQGRMVQHTAVGQFDLLATQVRIH